VSAPDVSPLAKKLQDELNDAWVRGDDLGAFLPRINAALDILQKRVESPPPAGPWMIAPHPGQGYWAVMNNAPEVMTVWPLRTKPEAEAVRDALNALGASKGTTE